MWPNTFGSRAPVRTRTASGAPNLSVISSEPNAPGIAELVRGTASFGDIITRDEIRPFILSPPVTLAKAVEALVRSYDHVVIDLGAAANIAAERFAPLAGRALLVSADPGKPATRAVRERLLLAGFSDLSLLGGVPEAAAA